MKALLIRDISVFFSNKNKIFILPLFLFVTYILFVTNNDMPNPFLTSMGSTLKTNINGLYISLVITLNGYFLWQAVYLYTYDIYYNPEFVFLRANKNKWLIYKYISIAVINIISHLIFVIIYLLLFKDNIDISNICYYWLIVSLTHLFIQYVTIALVTTLKYIGIIIMFTLILIPLFFDSDILEITNYLYASTHNDIYILLVVLFTVIVTTYQIIKININKLFEREV